MKKLIAYSSVAHMAFVTFGLFAFNRQGIEGAMIVMLSHGLVSGALFLCVGVIYDRLHTREIDRYGGLVEQHAGLCLAVHAVHHGQRRPARAPAASSASSSAWSAPIRCSTWAAIVATTGIILGAPTCSTSTGGSASASRSQCRRRGDARPHRSREWWLLGADRRGGAVDGRLSRKLPARRCAPTSAGCSSGSSAPRRRAMRSSTAGKPRRRSRHARGGGALMNQFAPPSCPR